MAYEGDLDAEIKLLEGWKRINLAANAPETADRLQRMIDKLHEKKKAKEMKAAGDKDLTPGEGGLK